MSFPRTIPRAATRIAIATLWLCLFRGSTELAAQTRRLSLPQVEKLVEIHTPDNIVAQEIRSRGLDFSPTPKILDQLRQLGAGQAILAIVREQIPVGTLEIQGPPGSQVSIDSISQGPTDARGVLIVANLPAGNHHLSLREDGYRPGDFDISLAAKEYKRFPVQLDWAGGYLTVRSYAAGSTIQIAGLGEYKDGVYDLKCLPGTYSISLMLPGMISQSQTVVVAAGQHATVDVHLAPDPQYFQSRLKDAEVLLASGSPQSAIQIANTLLTLQPANSEARSMLASAYFRAKDLQHFQIGASEAIRDGGSVALDLTHEHLSMSGEAIHAAKLTITAKSIAYDPGDSGCKYPAFTTPLSSIQLVDVTNRTTSGMFVIRHLTPGTFLLHLEIRDPSKSGKTLTFYFATADSHIEQQNDATYLASPADSSQVLGAAAAFIRSMMSPSH
ncbi:MAG TPA: hypothetical protein VMG82_24990 [Candidatus Sulfotelmatobacter sp.]|nr:hypothetical protein [Candidatus Sulfotelmatobacter sp.]